MPFLLTALGTEVDRALEHALIYALMEINDRAATTKGLADSNPRVRRGTLIALDQMDEGALTRELVTPLLDTDDFALKQAVLDVIARRPEWSDDVVDVLKQLIKKKSDDKNSVDVIRGSVIAFAHNEKVQQLVAGAIADSDTTLDARLAMLEAIGLCELPEIPEAWRKQLLDSLLSRNAKILRQSIATIGLTGDGRFAERLIGVSNDPAVRGPESIAALCTAAELGAPISLKSMRRLVVLINPNVPPMKRLAAARAIGVSNASSTARRFATQAVRRAGPLELPPMLSAFSKSDDDVLGKRLVDALSESPGLTSLTPSGLSVVLKNYSNEVKEKAEPLFAKLKTESADQAERLALLEAKLTEGNVESGKAVFLSTKTSCYACHRVGETGGQIGPDLSQIGARRGKRDLLEAILYPSSSLVRGYESVSLATTDGKVHSGLITRQTAAIIHLRTAQQTEIRLRRDDIEEIRPSRASIMPGGLDKTMTEQQLRDLIAYLQSLK
ncbi:MAG: c-type cytochrome [Planctomycetes bacterium]|nr:c-type cytochrome [Planctomycetota bacterium]